MKIGELTIESKIILNYTSVTISEQYDEVCEIDVTEYFPVKSVYAVFLFGSA